MKSYQKQSMEITIKPSWNPVKIHSKSPYLRSARTSAVVPSAGAATSTTQWRPSWPGPGCDGRPRGSCPVTKNQSLLYVIMVGLYVVMVITTIINVILCYYMLQLCYNYVTLMVSARVFHGFPIPNDPKISNVHAGERRKHKNNCLCFAQFTLFPSADLLSVWKAAYPKTSSHENRNSGV